MRDLPLPILMDLVTDDGKPVDNLYVERLSSLLVEPLYSSWRPPGEPGRPFVAMSNVGWFATARGPLAPDILVSLDIAVIDQRSPEGRAYFQWIYGKAPDIAIEIVSNRLVDESGERLRAYQRLGLPYYVIHDPDDLLGEGELQAYELRGRKYERIDGDWIEQVGLGLTMWKGTYMGYNRRWLRWCERSGNVIPTGMEQAESFVNRTRQASEQLRKLGIEPEA